jgi:hypothetical protein
LEAEQNGHIQNEAPIGEVMFSGLLANEGNLFQLSILDHGFRLKPLQRMFREIQKEILEMMVMGYHSIRGLLNGSALWSKRMGLTGWFFLKEFCGKIK